jgi:hypothetical protein
MALVSVKDFGLALNISGGTIRSKLSRKQLLRNRNKLIDTEHPINLIYLLELNGGDQTVFKEYDISVLNKTNVSKKSIAPTEKTKNIIIKEPLVKKATVSVKKTEKTENEEVNDSKGSVKVAPTVEIKNKKGFLDEPKLTLEERKVLARERQQRLDLVDLDLRKRTAETTLVERNSELRQLQLEKIAGNTLPLDITKSILMINIQTIFTTFNSEIDNMVTITVEELGGTRADAVRVQNKLKVVFKKLIETTKENSNREIEKVVNEYADVRSRGERK